MNSLSEELSHIVNPEPTYIDPEDDIDVESSAQQVLRPKTAIDDQNETHFNEYINNSVLRRKQIQLLSDTNNRYSGKKVQRKALEGRDDSDLDQNEDNSDVEEREEEEEEEEEEGGESDGNEMIEFYSDNIRAPKASIDGDISGSDSQSSQSSLERESDEHNCDEQELQSMNEDLNDEQYVNQFSNIDVNDEMAKGMAVKNQLLIFDNLLEIRIKLQKLVMDCNKMPQLESWALMKKCNESQLNDSLKGSTKAVKKLLNLLIDIDDSFDLHNYINSKSETKPNNENIEDEEITSDDDMETVDTSQNTINSNTIKKRKLTDCEYPEFLSKKHCDLVSVRNDIIDKWYERTRFSSANFKHKSLNAFEQSSTKQIQQILSDMERLIKRTQIKRSVYDIIGKNNESDHILTTNESNDEITSEDISKNNIKELDPEIFDDDDFYHQLLRELIETKTSGDVNDPIALSRKWIEIQKLRNKMKRKVDTKASKGRKVRYDVHSKLVNFMAPIDCTTYSEEAKNELFNSLFGKKLD